MEQTTLFFSTKKFRCEPPNKRVSFYFNFFCWFPGAEQWRGIRGGVFVVSFGPTEIPPFQVVFVLNRGKNTGNKNDRKKTSPHMFFLV